MIPEKYAYLEKAGVLPPLIAAGLQYLGVKEIAGKTNNPVIMSMAKTLGLEKIYTSDDQQSWCALYINFLIHISHLPEVDTAKDPYNLLRAKWMLHWGHPVGVN